MKVHPDLLANLMDRCQISRDSSGWGTQGTKEQPLPPNLQSRPEASRGLGLHLIGLRLPMYPSQMITAYRASTENLGKSLGPEPEVLSGL